MSASAVAPEPCPLVDLSPELRASARISAGAAGQCDSADGVCEACQ